MATKKGKDIALEKANAKYVDHLKEQGKNARTIATYERLLGLSVQHFGADKPLSKLTPAQVGSFFKSDVVCKKPNGAEKTEITRVQTRRVFRMMLVWAVEQGLIAEIPVPKAEMEHARNMGANEGGAAEAEPAAQAG